MIKGFSKLFGVFALILLALVGWFVLFVQKPDILAKARLRYNQAIFQKQDLSSGPCLGKIADDWVLDVAHLPRQDVDNDPANQCAEYRSGKAHHFVEVTPQGEIIVVQ